MELFENPEFWSALIIGLAIAWMTIASQWKDSTKTRLNRMKRNSAHLYKVLDHAYDVQVLVVKHNRIEHPDGEGSLEIPETPEARPEG